MRKRAETMPRAQLHGWVAPGFEPVQQTFADNFAQRDELGAACIQIPAASGIGTVRAIARCFGELATDARTLGLTDRTLNELTAPGIPPADGWGDLGLAHRHPILRRLPQAQPGLPLWVQRPRVRRRRRRRLIRLADPDLGLGYAYAPNRMGFHLFNDPREQSLRTAVYRCLGIQPRTPRRNR